MLYTRMKCELKTFFCYFHIEIFLKLKSSHGFNIYSAIKFIFARRIKHKKNAKSMDSKTSLKRNVISIFFLVSTWDNVKSSVRAKSFADEILECFATR